MSEPRKPLDELTEDEFLAGLVRRRSPVHTASVRPRIDHPLIAGPKSLQYLRF
jgi:hypothetical protein